MKAAGTFDLELVPGCPKKIVRRVARTNVLSWSSHNSTVENVSRNQLIETHVPLVRAMAKRLHQKHYLTIELDDLVSAGYEGLVIAADRYDRERGTAFGTYAPWWIRNRMFDQIRQQRWPMGISDTVYRGVLKFLKVVDVLRTTYGREPTLTELAEAMDLTSAKVRGIMAWVYQETSSLDMIVGDDGSSTLADFVTNEQKIWQSNDSDPLQRELQVNLREMIGSVLVTLTPREERVIQMRFGLNEEEGCEMTLEEIGANFAIGRERVRQIEAKALRKLRFPSRSRRLRSFLFFDEKSKVDK